MTASPQDKISELLIFLKAWWGRSGIFFGEGVNEKMKLQRLCYIHIPKTAGTAVTDVLQNIYPADKIFNATFMHEYTSVDPSVFHYYLLYKGHIHYSFAIETLPKDTQYITVLRDPVERVISLYFFIRNLPDDVLLDENLLEQQKAGIRLAKEKGIIEYLQASSLPGVMASTRNHQLKVLVDKKSFSQIRRNPEYVVDVAWSNIKNYFCYGIQEFLPFFIDELSTKLGSSKVTLRKVNQNTEKEQQIKLLQDSDLQHVKEVIEEYNQAEIMFYNRVKEEIVSRMQETEQIS
ncbi:sulfotransferase family 2 domain-containing protein [Nitrosococcus wardiae]|uniref:Sulfotransferase family protein n=1 Tax=Nitrosococcus wardiae TaxID=1814290 RepID=A0A4P7BW71_9GAMM|nr:sulfotransferase family 2 domain-containing protein [Nitrosococcus wardiae]QBQ53547.1 hypothetical protein E3U44_02775 [Nitrosococcus wardiae]